MRRFLVRRWGAGLLALFIGITAAGASGAPASAATDSYIATPNGMVGVQQTLVIYAPKRVNEVVTISGTQGTVGTTLQTVVAPSGFGSVFWVPTAAGKWTFSGVGSTAKATPTTVSVAAAPTTTVLEIPNTMQVNTPANLLIIVTSNLGDVAPVGQVTVSTAWGSPVGSAYLSPGSGAESAFATIPWTPTSTGVIAMVATFAPTNGSYATSTSAQVSVDVVSTPVPLSLRLPGSFNVGETVWVTAFVTPSNQQGTIAMQVDNQGSIAGSTPLTNGAVSVPWTPQNPGFTNIQAFFTNSAANSSGVASQGIQVSAALPNDSLEVAPTGQNAWTPGATVTVKRGQNLLMTSSSSSGSPVVINESGPCVINGALLMAVNTGTCVITATSGGSASFKPATATYNVSVVKPKKKKKR